MRLAAISVLLLCAALVPQRGLACAVLPDLGALISYARSVELGEPVSRGASTAAALALQRQDPAGLPLRMRRAGHADQVMPLLTFFEALRAVLDRALSGDTDGAKETARSKRFGAAFLGAQQAQTIVCDGLDEAAASPRTSGGLPARVGGEGHGPGMFSGRSPYETPLAVSARRMVVCFLGLFSALIIMHYALIWRRSALHRRRLVSIPAVLHAGTGTMPGRIAVLETGGAKFNLAEALTQPVPAGTRCTLSVGGDQFGAALQSGGRIAQHLVFEEALSGEAHDRLLKASLTPPRRDPMARDAADGRQTGYRYGQAHLIAPPPTPPQMQKAQPKLLAASRIRPSTGRRPDRKAAAQG